MNGTKFGEFLEEIVFDYDYYDEEDSAWGEVFGTAEEWGKRKKRAIENLKRQRLARKKRDNGSRRYGGKGKGSAMMGKAMEGMSRGEKMSFMAATGLQGLMMMDNQEMRMPKILQQIPSCLKQILWSPDDSSDGFICSKLTLDFKEKVREIMMIVLKREIPTSIFEVDWESIGYAIEKSSVFDEVGAVAMTKALLPIEAADISQILKPIRKMWETIEKNETDTQNRKILSLVTALMNAIDTEEVRKNVADMARSMQGKLVDKFKLSLLHDIRNGDLEKGHGRAHW